jgi:hypothetical protein
VTCPTKSVDDLPDSVKEHLPRRAPRRSTWKPSITPGISTRSRKKDAVKLPVRKSPIRWPGPRSRRNTERMSKASGSKKQPSQ